MSCLSETRPSKNAVDSPRPTIRPALKRDPLNTYSAIYIFIYISSIYKYTLSLHSVIKIFSSSANSIFIEINLINYGLKTDTGDHGIQQDRFDAIGGVTRRLSSVLLLQF